MIEKLKQLEKKEIVQLLSDPKNFTSLDVDYHPPKVERIWCPYGEGRLYFHFIHPCKTKEALYHPHPWTSAMHVIEGGYEMGIGYSIDHFTRLGFKAGSEIVEVGKLIISPDSYYEMLDPRGWHYVRPYGKIAKTVMLTGKLYDGIVPGVEKSPKKLEKLKKYRAEEIRLWFLNYYNEEI